MALTITKYKGLQVSVTTGGAEQVIYTVPAGKVSKIKFNANIFSTKNDNNQSRGAIYNKNTSYRAYNGGSNRVFTSDAGYGCQLNCGSTTIIGTYSNTASADYGHLSMLPSPNDSESIIIPFILSTMTSTLVFPADCPSGANFEGMTTTSVKNEFILTDGETVSFISDTNSATYANVNYDFTVLEEDA